LLSETVDMMKKNEKTELLQKSLLAVVESVEEDTKRAHFDHLEYLLFILTQSFQFTTPN